MDALPQLPPATNSPPMQSGTNSQKPPRRRSARIAAMASAKLRSAKPTMPAQARVVLGNLIEGPGTVKWRSQLARAVASGEIAVDKCNLPAWMSGFNVLDKDSASDTSVVLANANDGLGRTSIKMSFPYNALEEANSLTVERALYSIYFDYILKNYFTPNIVIYIADFVCSRAELTEQNILNEKEETQIQKALGLQRSLDGEISMNMFENIRKWWYDDVQITLAIPEYIADDWRNETVALFLNYMGAHYISISTSLQQIAAIIAIYVKNKLLASRKLMHNANELLPANNMRKSQKILKHINALQNSKEKEEPVPLVTKHQIQKAIELQRSLGGEINMYICEKIQKWFNRVQNTLAIPKYIADVWRNETIALFLDYMSAYYVPISLSLEQITAIIAIYVRNKLTLHNANKLLPANLKLNMRKSQNFLKHINALQNSKNILKEKEEPVPLVTKHQMQKAIELQRSLGGKINMKMFEKIRKSFNRFQYALGIPTYITDIWLNETVALFLDYMSVYYVPISLSLEQITAIIAIYVRNKFLASGKLTHNANELLLPANLELNMTKSLKILKHIETLQNSSEKNTHAILHKLSDDGQLLHLTWDRHKYNVDKLWFLIIERTQGRNLYNVLAEKIPPSLNDWRSIIFQILYTFEVFNRLGIRHNDAHGGNIFIEDLTWINDDEAPADAFYLLNKKVQFRIPVNRAFVKIFDLDVGASHCNQSLINVKYAGLMEELDAKGLCTNTKLKGEICEEFGLCNDENTKYDAFLTLGMIYLKKEILPKPFIEFIERVISPKLLDTEWELPFHLGQPANNNEQASYCPSDEEMMPVSEMLLDPFFAPFRTTADDLAQNCQTTPVYHLPLTVQQPEDYWERAIPQRVL